MINVYFATKENVNKNLVVTPFTAPPSLGTVAV